MDTDTAKFNCTQCGDCCRMFQFMPEDNEYRIQFDRGDGTCKHLNDETNLCEIYDERPDICNVEKRFDEFLHSDAAPITFMTREHYYQMQEDACVQIRNLVNG